MKLLFATKNDNKAQEIRAMLPPGFQLLSLNDIDFNEEIHETEPTFEGNALLKANRIFQATGIPCFADDSGLAVDALDGAPGVWSARFAGPSKNDLENNKKLLSMLAGTTLRSAHFKTVIAYVDSQQTACFHREIHGSITHEIHGNQGFGYDPVFIPEGWNRTFAEATKEEKNQVSHRAIAFQQLLTFLNTVNKK